jgi:hypothetical protein
MKQVLNLLQSTEILHCIKFYHNENKLEINNNTASKEIHRVIRKYFKLNENLNTLYKILGMQAKAVVNGKLML